MTLAPPMPGLRFPRPWFGLALALLIASGCHSFSFNLLSRDKNDAKADVEQVSKRPAPPSKSSFRIAPYVFFADTDIDRNHPLFQELGQLRNQISHDLNLPVGAAEVKVYLFETEDRYQAFIVDRYPKLPLRRAFFVALPQTVGGGEDLLVYTWRSPRIQQDLRHELTHAFLHSVLRNVPLWLDEGLAEYYELPPTNKGVNPDHVDHLCGPEGVVKPDLERLEKMAKVDDMKRPEYREAWAWVHLMLHSTPEAKAVLTSYLAQLRDKTSAGALGPKLAAVFPSLEDAYTAHVAGLASAPRAARASAER